MKTLLSGIQPTGIIHIGNYLGAIKQWVDLQKSHRVFIAIVDYHAITVPQEPKNLYENTLSTAALLIACGIGPKKSVLFLQSQVPAHTELGWILNTLTPVGELERMTQFKEKKEQAGVLAGLLTYPTLMASDILLYRPDVVPVGEDQLQHLELTRVLARKFNNRFGRVLKIPKPLAVKETARIMGLDDPSKKMSKSAANPANYIALLDSPADIRKKIKTAVTDSGKEIIYNPETKPAISNLITIYAAFLDNLFSERSRGATYREIEDRYKGKGYADFKNDLAELLIEKLAPIQERYQRIIKDKKGLLALLRRGAEKADAVASPTLQEAKKRMGFIVGSNSH